MKNILDMFHILCILHINIRSPETSINTLNL